MSITWNYVIDFSLTLIATLLGVLAAFRFDIFLQKRTKKIEDNNNRDILINSLGLINTSIVENLNQIDSLIASIKSGSLKISFQIDYFSWETHSIILNQFLNNIDLKNKIATYYLKMNYLLKMFELYYKYFDKFYRYGVATGDATKKKEYFEKTLTSQDDIVCIEDYVLYMLKYVIVGGNFNTWLPELRDLSIKLIKDIECEIRVLKMKD